MAIQPRVERTSAHHADYQRRRAIFVAGAVVGTLALLMWPLETLLVVILAGTVAVLLEGFSAWVELNPGGHSRQRMVQYATLAGAAAVILGAIAVAIWTVPMALATLMLALLACAMNAYARWSAHRISNQAVREPAVEPAPEPVAPVQAPEATPAAPARTGTSKRRPSARRAPARSTTRSTKRPPARRAPAAARRRTRQST